MNTTEQEVILIALLGAKGDCVYGTTLAHQIRHDTPECRLVWVISEECADILRNNPHVDEVWEIPGDSHQDSTVQWKATVEELQALVTRGVVSRLYTPQLWPDNFQYYDGTIRPSMYRCYGRPMTVPIESHVILDRSEEATVAEFALRNGFSRFSCRILVECSAKSFQSYMTPTLALEVAHRVHVQVPEACFVISTDEPLTGHDSGDYIIRASELSFRENLALTRHCTHFMGCGSGIGAMISTCANAARLPTLQILSSYRACYASLVHDFEYWGLDAEGIIEMRDAAAEEIAEALAAMCTMRFAEARDRFHQPPRLDFNYYVIAIIDALVDKKRYIDAARSLLSTVERYGWDPLLVNFAKTLLQLLPQDSAIRRRAYASFIPHFCKTVSAILRK